MLKLAFGQPIRNTLPRITPWIRFNSNTPRPTNPSETDPLAGINGGVSHEVTTSPKSADSATHAPAACAMDTLIEASTTPIPKVSTVLTSLTHPTNGLDPSTLPFNIPLESFGAEFTEEQYASTLVHGRAIHLPFFHPRTHDIPVASIQFRSHHPQYLDLFTHFATHAASSLGIPVSRVIYLPTKRTLWTVLRGPFAHKKSQENFERRVHRRAIKAWDADPEVVDRWVKYLRRHALGGVGMRVTKWERMPLGIGKTRLADVMERLESPASASADQIKALGDKIVVEELAAMDSSNRTIVPEHK